MSSKKKIADLPKKPVSSKKAEKVKGGMKAQKVQEAQRDVYTLQKGTTY